MNTDNAAVSGEPIDYGPCAFMDAFHPQCVFSSIDAKGRYAWGNQASIAFWNLTRLAETLLPLLSEDPDIADEMGKAALADFTDRFSDQYIARFRAKLGLPPEAPVEFIQETLQLLAAQEIDFTLFFRHLTRVAAGDESARLAALFARPEPFAEWLSKWQRLAAPTKHLAAMRASNPILIPRNHRVEEAIQSAYREDYAPFNRLIAALAKPYEENAEYTDLEATPRPDEVVHQTFCGT